MKFIYLFIFLLFPIISFAKRPLYELGAGAGAGYLAHYPASDQGQWRYLAFPTVIYRGHILRSDDRGTRARFFKTDSLDLDLSFGASFPASSKDNDARSGMTDLDWLAEVGPRINIQLYNKHNYYIELELPVRFAFSTDFRFTRHRGYRFYPQIHLRKFFTPKIHLSSSLKLNWASEQLTDYFYQVDGQDITPTRPAFDAKGGYVGSALSNSIWYNFGRLFYGLGIRYDRFDGSTNQNSPLFKRKENITFYFAFNYFFYQSSSHGVN